MMAGVAEFVLAALTDLCFLPALVQVARRRRHFELFVGGLQLVSAFMFNSSHALGTGIFIKTLHWHFMSDVLTLTYVCCLLVHCMGNSREDVNIGLRYTAFGCAWIFKFRDEWDSAIWEAALVVVYLGLAAYGVSTQSPAMRAQYDVASLRIGAGALLGALLLLAVDLAGLGDSYGLLAGLMHGSAAVTAWFLWKGVPVFDSKKNDDVLRKNASFV